MISVDRSTIVCRAQGTYGIVFQNVEENGGPQGPGGPGGAIPRGSHRSVRARSGNCTKSICFS